METNCIPVYWIIATDQIKKLIAAVYILARGKMAFLYQIINNFRIHKAYSKKEMALQAFIESFRTTAERPTAS